MVFTSLNFIVFLLITVVLFYMCTAQAQRILLLAANYVFYMWMKPVFGLLLLAGTAVTYLAAMAIQKKVFGLRKLWTAIGAVLILGQLVIFKYADFFLSGVGILLGRELPGLGLLLPIGISFYSFAAAGYLFDVQRGKMEAERNFVDCALFLSFFPFLYIWVPNPVPDTF